jgi:hypothetical protein
VPVSGLAVLDLIVRRLSEFGDPELLKPLPRLQCYGEPARLFAAAGPGFLGGRRITVFRQNLWIFAPRRPVSGLFGRRTFCLADWVSHVELRKTLLQFELFRADFFRENLRELLMQKPELIKIHGFQVQFTHRVLIAVRIRRSGLNRDGLVGVRK